MGALMACTGFRSSAAAFAVHRYHQVGKRGLRQSAAMHEEHPRRPEWHLARYRAGGGHQPDWLQFHRRLRVSTIILHAWSILAWLPFCATRTYWIQDVDSGKYIYRAQQ